MKMIDLQISIVSCDNQTERCKCAAGKSDITNKKYLIKSNYLFLIITWYTAKKAFPIEDKKNYKNHKRKP